MEFLLLFLIVIGGVAFVANRRSQKRQRELEAAELQKVRSFAEEDVTKFGEELQALDADVTGRELDEPTRQDYERALDEYEAAKDMVAKAERADQIKHVTTTLEDGKYAVSCVRARINGDELPKRLPPCFFNPQHGPSVETLEWAPPGGAERKVPVCLADAERLRAGAEPDIRKVDVDGERVPYWQGGPAYAPFMQGYFAGFATSGLLPAFFIGSMMGGMWGGYGDGGYGDAGGDGGGGADGGDGGDMGGGDMGDGGDFGDFGGFGDFGF